MKIGIIGSGMIGSTVGSLWARAGHTLCFGSRDPRKIADIIEPFGKNVTAASIEEAAAFGETIFFAFPYGIWPEMATRLAPLSRGKVVLDAANPYPPRDGEFAEHAIALGLGAGVPVARLLPQAHLVRAFSTVYYATLESEAHRHGDLVGIPLAGDDAGALVTAAQLVRDAGFEAVLFGALENSKTFDPGQPIYNTGYSAAQIRKAVGIT